MIKITFPDGNVKEFETGTTAFEIAISISKNFSEKVICAEINGILSDLNTKLNSDSKIIFFTFDDDIGKEVYWHSTAHLMAQAVKELFPKVKVTIGPAIEEGFYYDFERDCAFTEEELITIENKMMELSENNYEYHRSEITRSEAIKRFMEMNEPYKIELLEAIPENEKISIYQQGSFVDLCRGPHILKTNKIKAVKLLKTSGSYWRGDEKNAVLRRIYGISFPSKKELTSYLTMIEEAKKRDHRKLGRELDLYSISDDVGAGLVLWHPRGALMRHIIESYWKQRHIKAGYELVYTPHIGRSNLWVTSGHLGFYSESMYAPINIDDQEYLLKPMNCPYHISIYKSSKRSFRELPIKYAELGTVYRYERSGTLHGLMRVRGFTQDDAHIFCTSEQLIEEVEKIIEFSISILNGFGFHDFEVYLATKPEKSVGEDSDWEKAIESLKLALNKFNLNYKIDEGGGAFYGPKIDIKIKDALNRSWQCSTIQFDFNMSARFGLEYIGSDNSAHRPFMIHRALMGSLERFFGTLIEFYGGNFPTWLCPTQVILLSVSTTSENYTKKVYEMFLANNIRASIDVRNEKIGYKIREAEINKIPFIMIIGEKEEKNNSVSIRRHTKGDMGSHSVEEAIVLVKEDIKLGNQSLE
jgi:threonyl-tRNA synthetase